MNAISKTNEIIEQLKRQFISESLGGKIFELSQDELNTCFYFENDDLSQARYIRERINVGDAYNVPTPKESLFRAMVNLHPNKDRRHVYPYWTHDDFKELWRLALIYNSDIIKTLECVRKFLVDELIQKDDIVITNINPFMYALVHIINSKYIIELEFRRNSEHLRKKHIIKRDIKSIDSNEKEVRVYFHGVTAPFKIGLPSYKEVVALQDLLTNYRH